MIPCRDVWWVEMEGRCGKFAGAARSWLTDSSAVYGIAVSFQGGRVPAISRVSHRLNASITMLWPSTVDGELGKGSGGTARNRQCKSSMYSPEQSLESKSCSTPSAAEWMDDEVDEDAKQLERSEEDWMLC